MDIYFVFKKVKMEKAFLKQSSNDKLYYQLLIKENNRSFKNVVIFEDKIKGFENLSFDTNIFYGLRGKVLNLSKNRQILSVSKIIPLCENNKLGSEESHLKPMGVKN